MNRQYQAGWGMLILLLLFVAGLAMNVGKVGVGIIQLILSDSPVNMDMALPVILRAISLSVPVVNSLVGYF